MKNDDPKKLIDRLMPSDNLLGGAARDAAGPGAEPEDSVELWARRFGRGLAILASIGLVAWALADFAQGPAQ